MARLRGIAIVALLGVAVLLFAMRPSATQFFAADFEVGDTSQWAYVQTVPGGVSAVEGPAAQGSYAGRFEVEEGAEDPDTGSQRAEVTTGLQFVEPDTRYFRILSRVDSWDYDHWGIIWQIHDQTDGSPPLSLQLLEDDGTPMLWVGPGNASTEYWEAPLPATEEWFEIVIKVEFGEEGSVGVWLDGAPQTMSNGEASFDGVDTLGEGPGYDKLGIYRSPAAGDTGVVYHDDYRVTGQLFSEPPE